MQFFKGWTGENCLLVPPVDIVTQVLQYMAMQKAIGTLVVPLWPSAAFWPLFWQRFVLNIVDYRYYKGSDCCVHGRNTTSIIGSPDWESYVIAVRMNFA